MEDKDAATDTSVVCYRYYIVNRLSCLPMKTPVKVFITNNSSGVYTHDISSSSRLCNSAMKQKSQDDNIEVETRRNYGQF